MVAVLFIDYLENKNKSTICRLSHDFHAPSRVQCATSQPIR